MRRASPGIDGVTWQEYESGFEDRLVNLHSQVHRGVYRAKPSRQMFIPKADGRQRPLGVAALEDKIFQQAVVTILNQIHEVDCKCFSYGFRPGRIPRQALDALMVGVQRKRVTGCSMTTLWLCRVLRLIQRWLKVGVSEDRQWSETKLGTPQEAVVSPLLASVCLHYVFDLWAELWRKKATFAARLGYQIFCRTSYFHSASCSSAGLRDRGYPQRRQEL